MSEKGYERASDKKIEELLEMLYESQAREAERDRKINEMHQRQSELTIPSIELLKNCVFGEHGNSGLVKEVSETRREILEHKESHKIYWVFVVFVIGVLTTIGNWVIQGFKGK